MLTWMYSEKYIAIQSKHFSDVGHILLILGMAFIMSFSFSLYFLMEFSQYLKNSISVRSFQTEQWITKADVWKNSETFTASIMAPWQS